MLKTKPIFHSLKAVAIQFHDLKIAANQFHDSKNVVIQTPALLPRFEKRGNSIYSS